jgi:hypothetical protein
VWKNTHTAHDGGAFGSYNGSGREIAVNVPCEKNIGALGSSFDRPTLHQVICRAGSCLFLWICIRICFVASPEKNILASCSDD